MTCLSFGGSVDLGGSSVNRNLGGSVVRCTYTEHRSTEPNRPTSVESGDHCPKCKSVMVMVGPFYARGQRTCLNCGHRWDS